MGTTKSKYKDSGDCGFQLMSKIQELNAKKPEYCYKSKNFRFKQTVQRQADSTELFMH